MDVRSNIGLHLAKRAEMGPNLEAVFEVAENRRLTYSELNERADRLAEGLRSLGLNYGDRVGLLLPNSYRFMEVYYGAAKAGIIVVPLNTRLVADEVGYILRDSG